MMTATTDFLGFRFEKGTREALFERLIAMGRAPYGYVVTPNVDFVNRAARDPEIRALYDGAAVHLCDSKVLTMMAKAKGVALDCYPGSDLVADLLARDGAGQRIAVVGPDAQDWQALVARYPAVSMTLIPSPAIMTPGSAEWRQCVTAAAGADWDILLLCLGSPKQERFAQDVGALRHAPGVAWCVGASIDFLTGRQTRAPHWVRACHLEWLHRLASNPRRLWRRYLVEGPQIIRLLLQ
ncbi:WecB/TagA/CpsF family glycosyltransferase [Sphingomonas fuzhouensis]|uniref:WecB/TagA/CpsF family glycosyltransferase n=1 Tax=Sphingomonas fuzhouensis TaxID=3106033 RepID=UPI002AFFC3B1|nr:WecB/TagA/CpsF family glycosyltransferase [Sphingomonas sp. SGZ-02]